MSDMLLGKTTHSGAGDTERSAWSRISVGKALERYSLLGLLSVLIIFFSLTPSTSRVFLSAANLQNILANQSVTGFVALGMVVPLIAGYFDLSVAAVAGLSNLTMAALLCTYHTPIWVAVVCGIGVGAVVGLFNGLLAAVLRLNALIATLATYILLSGLMLAYTSGQTISNGFPEKLGLWGSGKWIGVARPFWLLIIGAIVIWYIIALTPYGRRLTAIGSSEIAARLAGIRVTRAVLLSFVASGLLGGIAGVLLTIRTGSGDATTGISYLFPALAAVFLGQTVITPGRANVWGTMIGVFLVAVAVNGLTLLGAQTWVQQVFNGLALLLSLIVSAAVRQMRDRRARRALLAGVGDTEAE
jgi:ribose transport system permease protein